MRDPAAEGIAAAKADENARERIRVLASTKCAVSFELMNDVIAQVQQRLGITHGDFAGAFFTGDNAQRLTDAEALIAEYIEAECDSESNYYK